MAWALCWQQGEGEDTEGWGRQGVTPGWGQCHGRDIGAEWKLELPLQGLVLGALLSLSWHSRQGLG